MSTSLLIAEPPLQVLPRLAQQVGLNEAIILQQVYWREARSEDGWVRRTYSEWAKYDFPFWSARTVERVFGRLREKGVLTVEEDPGTDRTLRYKVNLESPLFASRQSDGLHPDNLTVESRQVVGMCIERTTEGLTANAVNPLVASGDAPAQHFDDLPIETVFTEWVPATKRDPSRTKLGPERRRIIRKALKSHGVEDCLAAVRNIGRDKWAAGDNDRGIPFNDIKHALGSTEKIERWRDWKPGKATGRAGREALMMR